MIYSDSDTNDFHAAMEGRYGNILGKRYGGFAVSSCWFHIIEQLLACIQEYLENNARVRAELLESNPNNWPVPEAIPPVQVLQIKEKFGGLRFYYEGGDSAVGQMVRMAERWARQTCEECGHPGQQHSVGGWHTTLCVQHWSERVQRLEALK